MPGASEVISDIFSGDASVGSWEIKIGQGCGVDNGSIRPCPSDAAVTSPSDGNHAGPLVLQAGYTISDDGSVPDASLSISSVQTGLNTCDAATAPADCGETTPRTFTARTLESAIPVEGGQDVDVTVIISFSSG